MRTTAAGCIGCDIIVPQFTPTPDAAAAAEGRGSTAARVMAPTTAAIMAAVEAMGGCSGGWVVAVVARGWERWCWGFTGSSGEGGEEEVRNSCRFLRKEREAREDTAEGFQ
jgi:hypothetical protein